MTAPGWWSSDSTPIPITGWWAELWISSHITVSPSVSVSHGRVSASAALMVSPQVVVAANLREAASITQLVSPSVTASVALVLSETITGIVSPQVSASVGMVKTIAATASVSPSVTVGAEVTDVASVSAAATVTPSVSVSAAVLKPATVTASATPSVSTAAKTSVAASVPVSPAVSAAGSVIKNIAATATVTPSVAASAALIETVTASVTVTPSVSVSASVATPGPTFDAVGAGATNDDPDTSVTWAHTAASGADLFVYIDNLTTNSSFWPTAVTYNGTAMTRIATNSDTGGSSGTLLLFHLAHAGNGSSENVVATWGTNPYHAVCNSISFNNVGGVGSPSYAQDSNTESTPTQSTTLALPGTLILQGFAYQEVPGTGAVTTSGGTQDYSFYDSGFTTALTINHAASTQTFTGSISGTYWAGIAVALYPPIPVSVTVPPSVSVSMGAATVVAAASVTVSPSVAVAAAVIKPATVSEAVTPTVTSAAGVTKLAAVAETVTPTVSVAGNAVISIASAVTASPSVSTATSDDTSIFVTVTPSVSVGAQVIKPAAVAATVTPAATVAAKTSVAAAVTVSPAVSVVGDAIDNIAATVTVTPSVSAAGVVGETIVNFAASTAVTPAVSVTAGVGYPAAATATVTPSVSVAAQLLLPVSASISVSPSVSVTGSVQSGPTFDAVGAGAATPGSTSMSWSHTATAGAYVVVSYACHTTSSPNPTVKYGGTAMTKLGTSAVASNSFIQFWGLAGVAGGAQTVTITSALTADAANSISLKNVTSVGTPASQVYNGSPFSQAVTCTSGQVIVQSFEAVRNADITSAASGGTSRYYDGSGFTMNTATATTTFTATSSGQTGAGMAVVFS